MLYMALAFGIDYPFALFSCFTILSLTALRILPLRLSRLLPIVVLAFGIPFLLRQMQVISVVGADFWIKDVAYSVIRRVPAVGLFVSAPDETTLRALYEQRNVVKWPGEGALAPARWVARVGLAYFNVLGLPFFLIAGVWAAGMLTIRRPEIRTALRRGGRPVIAAGFVALGLAGGLTASFLTFSEYFAGFYGVLLMPLVVHWVVVLLALTAYVLLAHRRATIAWAGRAVPIGALLLAAFVIWRVGTEVRHYLELPPRPYPGRAALEQLHGQSVVTFWISRAVSTYTAQWAATLNDPRWRVIRPQDLPFDPRRDYYFFMEADKDSPRYPTPDFLFIPALHVPVLDNRFCRPRRGRILALADGCSDLEPMARRLSWLPLYQRGPDYLLYDLRPVYRRPAAARAME
jgi:hypothetical protein